MVVDMILGGAIFKSGHFSVVTIREDPHAVEELGKKLRRPENARFGSPGVMGMSVQAVDEDDVDLRGFVGAVDLGEAVGFDFVWIRHLLVEIQGKVEYNPTRRQDGEYRGVRGERVGSLGE